MTDTPSAAPQPHVRPHGDAEPRRDHIQERAYYRYVERGRTDGQALDDWLVAETEIRAQANPNRS
jgi:hypothetical protein